MHIRLRTLEGGRKLKSVQQIGGSAMIVEILANISIALGTLGAWLFTPPALANGDYDRQRHQQ
jgi:hypothetical protein